MKYIYESIAVILLSASVSMPGFAEDKPMNMQKGQSSGQGMNKSMDMGMSEEMKDKQARGKQEYILKRDELSDQIRAEKKSNKKQALMDEQLQLIKNYQEKKRKMKKMMMKKHHQKMMNQKKSMNM